MKYHCTGCDYTYDEMKWDDDLGIEAHTFFDALPNDFFCPFCDTHKDDFVVLEEVINEPLNVERLTPFEAEHFPSYEIVWDTLKYEIGQIEHPMQEDHFVYKIELRDESGDKIEEKKFQIGDEATGTFDIEYLDSFELRVYCSRDGIFTTGMIER